MDIRMPVMDGLEATRRIIAGNDDNPPRVLMLTTFDLDEYVFDALVAGASGFLLKDVAPEQLLAGIHIVAQGDSLLSPSVTRRLIESFVRDHPRTPRATPGFDELTARELEILRLIARGLSNAEIAEQLVVSSATIKTHVGASARQARAPRPRPGRRARLRNRHHPPRQRARAAALRHRSSGTHSRPGQTTDPSNLAHPASAASTFSSCSAGLTFRKMWLILPSASITKVVRSLPM